MTHLLIHNDDIDVDLPCDQEVERGQWFYNVNNQVGYEAPKDYSHLPDANDVAAYVAQEDLYYSQLDAEEAKKEREWINAEILRQEAEDVFQQQQFDSYVEEWNARERALEITEKEEYEKKKSDDLRYNKLYIINIYRYIKEDERHEEQKFEEDCERMEAQRSLEEENI